MWCFRDLSLFAPVTPSSVGTIVTHWTSEPAIKGRERALGMVQVGVRVRMKVTYPLLCASPEVSYKAVRLGNTCARKKKWM